MSGGELLLAVILLVLASGYLGVYLWARAHVCKPKQPAPRVAPLARTPLAAHVLAAHKAAEHHDLAVLTGTAEQVEASLIDVISTSNELAGYLHARTEKKQ